MNPFVKGLLSGVLVTVLLLVGSAAVLVYFGLLPVNADATPSELEDHVAGMARDAAIERAAPKTENPVKLSDANLMDGMKLYRSNCQGCHGGPNDKDNVFASSMYPPIPQFPGATEPIDLSEPQMFWIAKHGIRLSGMPAFTAMMKEDELWKTALFIKTMTKLPAAVTTAWKAPK